MFYICSYIASSIDCVMLQSRSDIFVVFVVERRSSVEEDWSASKDHAGKIWVVVN